MLCDLILDGNYLLNKNVFALHKNNLLFGALEKSLEVSVTNYRRWFPFANVYFVSDSKEKSWRKKFNNNYKAHRKRDDNIDWEFVHETYDNFKNNIKWRGVKVIESPHIEGDDWVSYLKHKSNSEGKSTIIVSNDHDIKQLINWNINPLWINVMTNEIINKQKLFLPKNYQIFLNEVNKLNNDDIFNLNDNSEFITLLNSFIEKYDVQEVDPLESLIIKVISGDSSDNITSVWSIIKNGRKRGIGEIGAKSVIENYVSEFGELSLKDPDLYENIADLICEKKKLSKSTIESIKENIIHNMRLIHLDIESFPPKIQKILEDEFIKLTR